MSAIHAPVSPEQPSAGNFLFPHPLQAQQPHHKFEYLSKATPMATTEATSPLTPSSSYSSFSSSSSSSSDGSGDSLSVAEWQCPNRLQHQDLEVCQTRDAQPAHPTHLFLPQYFDHLWLCQDVSTVVPNLTILVGHPQFSTPLFHQHRQQQHLQSRRRLEERRERRRRRMESKRRRNEVRLQRLQRGKVHRSDDDREREGERERRTMGQPQTSPFPPPFHGQQSAEPELREGHHPFQWSI